MKKRERKWKIYRFTRSKNKNKQWEKIKTKEKKEGKGHKTYSNTRNFRALGPPGRVHPHNSQLEAKDSGRLPSSTRPSITEQSAVQRKTEAKKESHKESNKKHILS